MTCRNWCAAPRLRCVSRWLSWLDEIKITSLLEQVELLADGDNIVMSWQWPNGEASTAVIYIDHNTTSSRRHSVRCPG